jgi:hypothetical protein
MHQLANSVVLIHGAAANVKQKAVKRHAEDPDKKNTTRERITCADTPMAIERRVGRKTRSLPLARAAVLDRATKMRDQQFVPGT